MRFLEPSFLKSVDSTNLWLRRSLEDNPELASGQVVYTFNQTAGKGQFGREWLTVPGRDLAMSFFLRSEVELAAIPSMPMAIALSIRDTLKRFGIDARVKWPNDVLVRGHKIAGILVEHLPSKSGSHLIAGIGINVNMTEDDSLAIDREVTSILMQNGVETDPMPVMSGLLEELRGWLGKWESGGFQAIRHDWIEAAVGVGSRAVVRQPKQNIEGILEGFGEFGELVIKQDGGRRRILWSGDLLLDCAV